MHLHNFFEAHFIINGTAKYALENKKVFDLSARSGIIFSPSTKHIILDQSNDIIKFSLTFMPKANSSLYSELSNPSTKTFPITDEMLRIINSSLEEIEKKSFLTADILRNNYYSLIFNIVKNTTTNDSSLINIHPDDKENSISITTAKQYISDNNNRLLTCKEVANYCHFNEKYLGRIFKEQTGMTLLNYIHSEKIKQAENLLLYSNYSLKTISEILGFANEYYFNSFFKKRIGIPPGNYKKNTK